MATYSIRDLEKVSGIKAHTIRMWEQRYAILDPKRTDTNIRYYDEDDLRLILSISMLNMRGYKISRIAEMKPEEIHQACRSFQDGGDEYQQSIGALTMAMVDMDELRFEKVLGACALKYGLEETMLKVIYPFYERVGILWQTGTIRPAQEHFISNLIRQKLIVAIDAQEYNRDSSKPRVVLFLPEHELHEVGLLFSTYVLRSRGFRVVYLGQSVPEDDLSSVQETHPSSFFMTIMTIAPQKESAESFINRICGKFPEVTFLVAGAAVDGLDNTPKNFKYIRQISDLVTFLERTAIH